MDLPGTGGGSGPVRRTLESLCAAGASGALRVIGDPGGDIYLSNGQVASADCPLSCDVERMLTASGRLPREVWRAAVAAGVDRVGDFLVEGGHVTAPELELCVLTATLDSALFILDAPEDGAFEPDVPRPFRSTRCLDYGELCAEVDQRRRRLNDAWPQLEADMSPVTPARRLPGQYIGLNAVQWEIVTTADGLRDPLELSHELGRGTYATLLEVRGLVAAGVLEVKPRQRRRRPPVASGHPAVPARASRPPAPAPAPESRPPSAAPAPESRPPPAAPAAEPRPPARRAKAPDALPHRGTDTQVPWLNGRPTDLPAGADFAESTLLRIRDALQALG